MSHAASQNQTLYSLCSFSLANQLHVLMYHALVVLTSLLAVGSNTPTSPDEEATLPVTSFLCQWKAPRKRKESNLPIINYMELSSKNTSMAGRENMTLNP